MHAEFWSENQNLRDPSEGQDIDRRNAYTEFRSENLKLIDHSENLGVDGKIIIDGPSGDRMVKCELDTSESG
jgi:hypothetical protein